MNPGMRLKVRGDTFYLPDTEDGVYFRNNSGSFRMRGSMIDRWIERLFPVWNGEHTLEELTDGLPEAHRNRLYEIAETLHSNGFVRDVSTDRKHELPEAVTRKFVGQIEFLDHFGGSGAYRFQQLRNARVLVVGSGSFVLSLVSALLDAGLPAFRWLMTEASPEDGRRAAELAEYARRSDPAVRVEDSGLQPDGGVSWREIVKPFEWILYASRNGGKSGELQALHTACREEGRPLIPAVMLGQTGVVGPVVLPDSPVCWESALRRLHRAAIERDPQIHEICSTTEALLANTVAFEWFKAVTAAIEPDLHNQVYLLNLETLEGGRHAVLPHPLAGGRSLPRWQECAIDWLPMPPTGGEQTNDWMAGLSRLTSPATGIFHVWDEGDLKQLPLSLCRVQAVDPLSAGPAELLPERICGGFTHMEARREAGLSGIEDYAARLHAATPCLGIGAGETIEEGIARALKKALCEELRVRVATSIPDVYRIPENEVEEERSRFYLTSLITLRGEPVIARGENLFGLPVLWVGSGGSWRGTVGFDIKSALRDILLDALVAVQIDPSPQTATAVILPTVRLVENSERREFESPAESSTETTGADLGRILETLRQHEAKPRLYDLSLEPFMKNQVAGVFGVTLREEEIQR